jgi:5'-3' exonuclease
MSQIKKKYLDILNEINKEHTESENFHRNSKVLIIDGLNTFIRSWSTAPNLNDDGDHIGGIVGTLKSIGYAIRMLNPTRVIIAFDGKGGSKNRQKIYSSYKEDRAKNKIRLNRAYTDMMNPEDEQVSLRRQIVALGEALTALPVSVMMYDGIEADDVIGYIATDLIKEDMNLQIMSSDKDFIQLVRKNVQVYSPTKKKIYSINEVIDEFGIHPHNFINFRMMDGDTSDSIEGVKGLGIKTIIKNFKPLTEERHISIQELADWVEAQPKKSKAHNQFLSNLDICERNRRLMSLSELEFSGQLKLKIVDHWNEETPKFDRFEFMKIGLKYKILDSFTNVTDWLNSTFTNLNKYN